MTIVVRGEAHQKGALIMDRVFTFTDQPDGAAMDLLGVVLAKMSLYIERELIHNNGEVFLRALLM